MSLLRAPHPANGTISGSDAVHEIMKPHTSRAVVRTIDSDMWHSISKLVLHTHPGYGNISTFHVGSLF